MTIHQLQVAHDEAEIDRALDLELYDAPQGPRERVLN